jgi:hypothetical protein
LPAQPTRGRKGEKMKISISAKILMGYGFVLTFVLLSTGIVSNWNYYYTMNTPLLAFIIASFPILAIALTILEIVFGKDD